MDNESYVVGASAMLGDRLEIDLRQRVQAYLEGRVPASDLYNWTFGNLQELLEDPKSRALAGAVLGASWSVPDAGPQESLRKELREELAKAPR